MNAVSFESRECRLANRKWTPVGHEDQGLIGTLNSFTETLDGPGPADGFTTVDRHLAIEVARHLRGEILELDEVTIPPDSAGIVY